MRGLLLFLKIVLDVCARIYIIDIIDVCVGDNNRASAANGWSTENTPQSTKFHHTTLQTTDQYRPTPNSSTPIYSGVWVGDLFELVHFIQLVNISLL